MLSELILITSKQYNPIENMRLMNVTLLRRILSEKMTKMKNGEFERSKENGRTDKCNKHRTEDPDR